MPWIFVSFPKIRSGRIRAVRENQIIIPCDVCDHLPACDVHGRCVQGQAFETITAKAMKNATNVSETNLTWKWTTEDPSKGPPWYIPYAQ